MATMHGAATAGENLAGNINFYTMYVRELDIAFTGDLVNQSQQNMDDVVNIISLVAQPLIMNNPVSVSDLTGIAPVLVGAGTIFKFAVEHGRVFERDGDNVSILKELFHGITIDSTLLTASNIEFSMSDLL